MKTIEEVAEALVEQKKQRIELELRIRQAAKWMRAAFDRSDSETDRELHMQTAYWMLTGSEYVPNDGRTDAPAKYGMKPHPEWKEPE